MKPRAIIVCVNYYDILEITIANNHKFFDEILVITSNEDIKTQEIVKKIPNARIFITDSFYINGSSFNKGFAMEEGFDAFGRWGWICILDADILIPGPLPEDLIIGNLYAPKRKIVTDIQNFNLKTNYPIFNDEEFAGYFQLFHADDTAVKDKKPWYDKSWKHAGGCDSFFQSYWSPQNKIRILPEVFHLGEVASNWFGRTTDYVKTRGAHD